MSWRLGGNSLCTHPDGRYYCSRGSLAGAALEESQSDVETGPDLCCLSVEQPWRRSCSGRIPFFLKYLVCIIAVAGNGRRVGLLSPRIQFQICPGSPDKVFSYVSVF